MKYKNLFLLKITTTNR